MDCRLCDKGKLNLIASSNFTFSSNGKIDQCMSCFSCFSRRIPDFEDLEQYYFLQEKNTKQSKQSQIRLRRYLSGWESYWNHSFLRGLILPHLNKGNTVLSVGVGGSQFSLYLKKIGFNISVIEPYSAYHEVIDDFGIQRISFNPQSEEKNTFDIGMMVQSLHLYPDPFFILRLLKSFLKSGGKILGIVPNTPKAIESLTEAMKMNVFNNNALYYFSVPGMKSLLERNQFSNISCYEIGFSNKKVRKFFSDANYHFLSKKYEMPFTTKMVSLLHLLECGIGKRKIFEERKEINGFKEPNDLIFFSAQI